MNKTLLIFLIALFYLVRPAVSYADWNNNNGNWHGNNSNGHSSSNWHGHDHDHNRGFIGVNFNVWPDTYYYGAPYYPTSDAVLASAPAYQEEDINGTAYYVNNGSYYVYNGYSYEAVVPPIQQTQVIEPPPVAANTQAPAPITPAITPAANNDSIDSITLNIPNKSGGYTAVTLKKSGSGYKGPQGEFYATFPSVAQLEVIYAK